MLAVLILVLWWFSAYRIPKESSPSISFGIISISTVYPWVNSVDIDNLITHKIEHAIEDINGIKKLNSTSSIWISNVSVELYNDIDTKKTLQEIKDEISKINLPEDAEDPMVREISTNNEVMFQLVLYADQNKYPKNTLLEFSKSIIDTLEWTNGITSINIGWWFNDGLRWWSAIAEWYEIQIQIDKNKIQSLGLTLSQITAAIRNNNKNQPLWSYELGWLNYDFRIQWEYVSTTDIMNTTISNTAWYELKLKDIADYKLKYKDDSIVKYGSYKKSGYNSVSLVFNKKKWWNIFNSADEAKISINKLMSSAKYKDINYIYTLDLAEQIRDDYQNLGISGIQTLIIVFLCMLIFVSIKEAIIWALSIPLAFFITFMVLDYQGRTLNFMTNFSLILTLGIIIDLAIVIAEAAYNNMKLWYHAKTSVLMASRDFSIPLIAGTATTIIVFVPLLFLPWVTGKFLGYIPITVFSTLTAALCIWLTLSGVWFYLFNRHYKFYTPDKSKEKFLQKIDYEILMIERENKELKPFSQLNRKEQQLSHLEERYAKKLVTFLTNTTKRRTSIIVPIILLILSFMFLSPQYWIRTFSQIGQQSRRFLNHF
jgi:multidrug efflux pump